jgi:hypothetical protein
MLAVVDQDKAGVQFLDGPRRREAAGYLLGDIHRNPPRLIIDEQFGCGSLLRPNSPHTPEDQRQDDRRDDNCKASGID